MERKLNCHFPLIQEYPEGWMFSDASLVVGQWWRRPFAQNELAPGSCSGKFHVQMGYLTDCLDSD